MQFHWMLCRDAQHTSAASCSACRLCYCRGCYEVEGAQLLMSLQALRGCRGQLHQAHLALQSTELHVASQPLGSQLQQLQARLLQLAPLLAATDQHKPASDW